MKNLKNTLVQENAKFYSSIQTTANDKRLHCIYLFTHCRSETESLFPSIFLNRAL